MLDVWRAGLESLEFKTYLVANVSGLLMSLLLVWIAPNSDVLATTLSTYAIGASFPILLDAFLPTVTIDRHIKLKLITTIIVAVILCIVGFTSQDIAVGRVAMTVFAFTTIFVWGVVYAFDTKMNVDLSRARRRYTPTGVADTPLSRGNEERDVEV